MTTLTSRPYNLLPLTLSRSMTCNDRSSSTGSSPISSAAMHPDSLLIQNHGVTSPRLSSANSVSSDGGGDGCYTKNCGSPLTPPLFALSAATNSPKFMSQPLGDSSSDINNLSRLSNSFKLRTVPAPSSDQSEAYSNNPDDDDGTDRMSCCSDDSELSVGQEECCDNNNSSDHNRSVTKNNNNIINNNSSISRHSSVSNKQVIDDCESVDNCSSLSDDNRLASIGGGDNLASDDMSDDSRSPNGDVDPTLLISSAMRVPPIVRPSPTRLQEEFLRKSHLYAEELVKQQMQFVAAARASAFSLRHTGAIVPDVGKVGFRPHIKQSLPPEINENLVNFGGIHSHLSAISKISSQLTCGESALSRLTALGMPQSREPSHSPPSSINQLHQQHHHFMNNNLNETNLKFSIDNILKADFGRRITDPLLKRSSNGNSGNGRSGNGRKGSNRTADRNIDKQQHQQQQQHGKSGTTIAPIDLTNVVPQPTHNLQAHNISNNNNNNINNNNSSCNSSIQAIDKHQRLTADKSPNVASNSTATAATCTSANSSSQSSTTSPSSSASSAASSTTTQESSSSSSSGGPMVWPAWVYCTRYSDRPSSGPRTRKPKKPPSEKGASSSSDEKRPRTAFSGPQLARLKHEFSENRYLTERRRQQLSGELGLNEAQIKIWFQNKRAKIKKASGTKNPLALQLMAQGLYNHSTVPLTREEEELQELQAKGAA